MTIYEAAESLDELLRGEPWFTAVGVDDRNDRPLLYLYLKRAKGIDLPTFKEGWQGFPVEIRKMGTPRVSENP